MTREGMLSGKGAFPPQNDARGDEPNDAGKVAAVGGGGGGDAEDPLFTKFREMRQVGARSGVHVPSHITRFDDYLERPSAESRTSADNVAKAISAFAYVPNTSFKTTNIARGVDTQGLKAKVTTTAPAPFSGSGHSLVGSAPTVGASPVNARSARLKMFDTAAPVRDDKSQIITTAKESKKEVRDDSVLSEKLPKTKHESAHLKLNFEDEIEKTFQSAETEKAVREVKERERKAALEEAKLLSEAANKLKEACDEEPSSTSGKSSSHETPQAIQTESTADNKLKEACDEEPSSTSGKSSSHETPQAIQTESTFNPFKADFHRTSKGYGLVP
jgi:hypothetical protein